MKRLITRFWSETSAAVAFEAVILFPVLALAWIGSFAFFDAYRTYNTSVKATYTIADLISRQEEVDQAEIDGMRNMLISMIRGNDDVQIRVTQILRSTDDDYRVDGSFATGTLAELATPNLVPLEDRLPAMAAGERVILVESYIDYAPTFDVGLNDLTFDNFILTRPRNSTTQVLFDDGTTVHGTDHDDGAT